MSISRKWLLIRVTDLKTGDSKASVKCHVGLANFGIKIAARYAPDSMERLDMNEIIAAVKSSGDGKVVDVEDEEKNERVEIFAE